MITQADLLLYAPLGLALLALTCAIVALARRPQKPMEPDAKGNAGCSVSDHAWHSKPYLTNDDEQVYLCTRGCGSTLRHKFK